MDRVGQVFTSFVDAEAADDDYYAALSGAERVDILLALVEQYRSGLGPTAERFERVCQVAQLSRS